MNNIDKQYQALLQDILDNGVEKKDRTGTGTISVFGRQIRHKMSEGFPLLTTKKMYFKGIVTELLWFLRGDTNIKYLVDNDCHIWDGDCYANYDKLMKNSEWRYENRLNLDWFTRDHESEVHMMSGPAYRPLNQEEFINKIKTDDEFAKTWGELGPIYGKQWRSWKIGKRKLRWSQLSEEQKLTVSKETLENTHPDVAFFDEERGIDQIANLINDLKTNPDSRRLMVSAWNVGELDQMVLPPCHYGFQVYTRELSEKERMNTLVQNEQRLIYEEVQSFKNLRKKKIKDCLDERNIPTRAISLMWNQRSVDTFLGLPFNIASYGLLLEIIAKAVNMVPDELIGNLGDVHLYSNHVEQAKEQIGRERTHEEMVEIYNSIEDKKDREGLWTWSTRFEDNGINKRTREPYPLPTLKINSGNENWHLLTIDEIINSLDVDITFKTENYQSHPSIKAKLSN